MCYQKNSIMKSVTNQSILQVVDKIFKDIDIWYEQRTNSLRPSDAYMRL